MLDDDLVQYYQLLADRGDIQAQYGLGLLHYQGARGLNMQYDKALHYFSRAADAGNNYAMAYLGKLYLEGKFIFELTLSRQLSKVYINPNHLIYHNWSHVISIGHIFYVPIGAEKILQRKSLP